jgi:pimeloyl-ACP methyl ester carboxylesterase
MTDATSAAGAPTVLLVHGAFADGSSRARVIERLQAAEVRVQALVNPLRGLAADSAYVASAIQQTDGPVLAVGHSSGGAVITNAATKANATKANHVVGLVYVAAFAPEEGETVQQIVLRSNDSALGPALREARYPTGQGSETAVELNIDSASFPGVVAADLPPKEAAVLSAAQRPIADAANVEKSGPPAWKSLPAWAVVATADKAAGSDEVRSMAERARRYRRDAVIRVDAHATATPRRCWTPTAGCGPPWRYQATRPATPGCSSWPRSRRPAGGSGRWKGRAAMGPG